MNIKIIASFLVLLTLAPIPISFAASPGPSSWGTEAYGNFVKSLILPDDPLVQQNLHSIAPVQDQARFAQNLLKVYEFVSQLPLPTSEDSEFLGANWMSAPEILQYGRGDCKNHAVLLVTLVEALYKNTYRNLPRDLVWIMAGLVDPSRSGQLGGHVWVLLNMDEVRFVSEDAYKLIRGTQRSTGTSEILVGAEPPWSKVARIVRVNLDSFLDKFWWWPFPRQSVILDNHFYIELEATWNLSISEFFYKKYPYVELHDRWNSYEYRAFPNVNPPDVSAPGTGTLWLSSTNWHYGDLVSWRAQGLTPNGRISVTIRGSWGSVTFGDVIADSSGKAGFTFMIGRNILGSGQFVVTDRTTGSFLMQDYSLG